MIGLLRKPVALADLRRVTQLCECAQERCPGMLLPLCPHYAAVGVASFCGSSAYAGCPYYDDLCGRNLRAWVSGRPVTPPG